MYTVSLTQKGQATIPAALRRKYGLKNNVTFLEEKGKITVNPTVDIIELIKTRPIKTSKSALEAREFMEKNYRRV